MAIMVKNSNNISTDPEILQWKKYYNTEMDCYLLQ